MDTPKTICVKIDKQVLQQMPAVAFGGKIFVVQSVAEADRAIAFLQTQTRVGFDTETRPSFRKGTTHKVALMQVSTYDICFLFRLNMIGIPPSVAGFLADGSVCKVGLSLKDDALMLHERTEVELRNFVDLQDCVKPLGVKDMSLQKLYANFFGQRISKTQRLSNWEADVLSDRQKQYAAIDAWACLFLYDEIERLKATGNYRLIEEETNSI